MQELKPIHVNAEIVGGVEVAPAFDYYEREPVDKRIAELEAEIHNLKRSLIIARHEVAKARGKKNSYKYVGKSKEFKMRALKALEADNGNN